MSGFFRLSRESLCCKPLSGEISVQHISHCPVHPAGFAGITLASMDPRVAFVEDVLGFRFENGFLAKYLELGEPVEDLEFWFRNAQVFRELLRSRSIPESKHHDLLTLIESIRFDAQTLFPPLEGLEDLVFNTSSYEFSEEVESCKAQVISLVLAQERTSYSSEARN